jgi:hypothetical protein
VTLSSVQIAVEELCYFPERNGALRRIVFEDAGSKPHNSPPDQQADVVIIGGRMPGA